MYVVLGAAGNTGSVVAKKLLNQGKKIRAVGRSAQHLAALEPSAERFIGDVTDESAMTSAFAGADAAYLLIPPKPEAADFYAYQDRVAEAIASAIEAGGVKHAVLLSSVGADKTEKTGPILGLSRFEKRLARIPNLNLLNLRAAYFMENTLGQADAIVQMGYTVGPIRPELKFPMIAARDIGAYAAERLARLDFSGQQARELLGQRDLSYIEVTEGMGRAIGKPDLQYQQITSEVFRDVMKRMGMSQNGAELMAEMAAALDSGYIRPLEKRSGENTTPTSFETFVAEEFLPVYRKKKAAA